MAGVVNLTLSVLHFNGLWWDNYTHVSETATVWILFALTMKRSTSRWKVCLRVTFTSLWSSQRLQYQLKIEELANEKFCEGHHLLGFPWWHKLVNLPNNHEFAIRRLCYLKKRFQHNFLLLKKLRDTVNEYFSCGYARRVPCNELEAVKNKPVRYLTHHPVFQPEKKGKLESR